MPIQMENIDQTFLEMRWRCLSLAADLDRLQRSGVQSDPRLQQLRSAIEILLQNQPDRAARLQMLYSDK
jgi:hypothetical protein